jgi:hypothetical protein
MKAILTSIYSPIAKACFSCSELHTLGSVLLGQYHELLSSTDNSLTAAVLPTTACTITRRVHLVWYNYNITICGKHIIMNLILQSTLNYYSLLSEMHWFIFVPSRHPRFSLTVPTWGMLKEEKLLIFTSLFSSFHLKSCKKSTKIIPRD